MTLLPIGLLCVVKCKTDQFTRCHAGNLLVVPDCYSHMFTQIWFRVDRWSRAARPLFFFFCVGVGKVESGTP